VTNIGTQNINGFDYIYNPAIQTAFGLNPGQTSGPVTTTGPFIDWSIVGPSGANPAHVANVRCMNQTSGGVTRAQCFVTRSDNG
jgi:hypothetical protein